jgi:hypothetical protein
MPTNPFTHVLSTANSIETIAVGFFDEKEISNPLANFVPLSDVDLDSTQLPISIDGESTVEITSTANSILDDSFTAAINLENISPDQTGNDTGNTTNVIQYKTEENSEAPGHNNKILIEQENNHAENER